MVVQNLNHEDESSTVSDEDLFVQRGEDDRLLPVTEEAPQLGEVRVIPMTFGSIREYFGSGTQMDDIEPSEIAEILRNHVVDPDLSEITSDEVSEDMKPMAPQALLLAVMKASGVNVDMDSLQNQESVLDEGEGN